MPREFQRTQRLAERIRRVLGDLITRELRDPRMGFVTITGVEVSRDLSVARVYFSVLNPATDLEATREALKSAAGFLRRETGRQLVARSTPELRFIYDESTERAERIQSLVREPGNGGDGEAQSD